MEYDVPVFKVLASNDTSSAPGHQSGIVIPKDISDFFPDLPLETSGSQPTVGIEIDAELLLNGQPLGEVKARYQHQTWGGKRSPERRLTANLGALRGRAATGDIVLFQRSITEPNRLKLDLVTRKSPLFATLLKTIGNKRWGVLVEAPTSNADVARAEVDIHEESKTPFLLFGDGIERVVTTASKIARMTAFQRMVLKNFNHTCVVSRRKLVSPSGSIGIDAAHIVPLARKGTNDVRNGLALSKELHWAFDCGLIGVYAGKVLLSAFAKTDNRNEYLHPFEGLPILRAVNPSNHPDLAALEWHQQNVFLG